MPDRDYWCSMLANVSALVAQHGEHARARVVGEPAAGQPLPAEDRRQPERLGLQQDRLVRRWHTRGLYHLGVDGPAPHLGASDSTGAFDVHAVTKGKIAAFHSLRTLQFQRR